METLASSLPWPPPFLLKQKPYLRRARMRICAERGLIITVPKYFSEKNILNFLEKERAWIERTWHSIQPVLQSQEMELPEFLFFPALEETWKIFYTHSEHKKIRLREEKYFLYLHGNLSDKYAVQKILKKWLFFYAKKTLLPRLKIASEKTQLSFSQASIRWGTSRWGSCSAKQKISLNAKLIFLPREYAEYVIIHELCHTVHLNHSIRFWRLLEEKMPGSRILRKNMRGAHRFVPSWLVLKSEVDLPLIRRFAPPSPTRGEGYK